MRPLPSELTRIDCPELRKVLDQTSQRAAELWDVDLEEAKVIVVDKLRHNRVSRTSLTSARRCLRDILEQEHEED